METTIVNLPSNQKTTSELADLSTQDINKLVSFFSILISIDRRVNRQKGDVYEKPLKAECYR